MIIENLYFASYEEYEHYEVKFGIFKFRIKTEYVQIQNCKFERYKNSFKLQI